MRRILPLLILALLMIPSVVKAQNYDLVDDKEFQELNKLNPSLTGVLQRFRVLANQATSTDLGIETRLFKSVNYLGFNVRLDNQNNIDRQSYNVSYARDFKLAKVIDWKLGANMNYEVKIFNQGKQVNSNFNLTDFNGFEYRFDSINPQDYSIESKVFDLSLGTSFLFKNLVLGVTANHINTPDVSLQNGVEQLKDFAINAQLIGFFNIGKSLMIMPTGIYAQQGDDVFSSYGASINIKNITFNGQYEMLGDVSGIDVGVSYRFKKRHLFNLSYRNDLTSGNSKSSIISGTINSSIFKPKKDLEGVLDKIKALY